MNWRKQYDEVLDAEIWYRDYDYLMGHTYRYLRQLYRHYPCKPDLSLLKIRSADRWGIADAAGNVLVPPQFEGIGVLPGCSSAFLIWTWNEEDMEERCGLADRTGRVLLPPEYDVIFSVREDGALVSRAVEDSPVWIDWDGRQTGRPEWRYGEGFWDFHSGLKRVVLGDQVGHVDLMGCIIGGVWWDDAGEFGGSAYSSTNEYAAGMTWVRRADRYGFINLQGETVIEPVFEEVTDFGRGYDGLHCIMDADRAAVRAGGKWGYISDSGELVVDCIWDEAGEFCNGHASVRQGSRTVTIDRNGMQSRDGSDGPGWISQDEPDHAFAFSVRTERAQKIADVIDGLAVHRMSMLSGGEGWTPRLLMIYICRRLALLDLLCEADLSTGEIAGGERERALYDVVNPVLRRCFREKPDCTQQEKEELDRLLLDAAERYLAPELERWNADEALRNRYFAEKESSAQKRARFRKRMEEIREKKRQEAERTQ